MVRHDESHRAAAVVLGFCRDLRGDLALVLIQRATGGRHGGQLSLPGGNIEASDVDPPAAAVRETCEEIGVGPGQVHLLDALDVVNTRTTGYSVWPFIARLEPGTEPRWAPQRDEATAVIELPVRQLAADEAAGHAQFDFPGWDAPRTMPTRTVDDHVVWGLTLRLIEPHLHPALEGRWPL